MRRIATLLVLVPLLSLGATMAAAQTQAVTGTVTDAATGDALPFVTVVVQGTSQGVATDIDGNYLVSVAGPDAVLLFRYVGYTELAEAVAGRSVVNVALSEDSNTLDDAIVVGYGTQRRGDVTASVTTVEVDDANDGLRTAATDFLEGRVAGLSVIETSGEPGANVDVRIRGGTSITSSNQPLYVIDGIPVSGDAVTPGGGGDVSTGPAPNPLTLINPNDIQTITVLKDASATAIYGSRGANGVILITTRRGVEGQTRVTYEGNVAVGRAASTYNILTGDEIRALVSEISTPAAAAALQQNNTDFQGAIFKQAVSQTHNLSFSGGNQIAQYRASLSYLNEDGIVISSGQERITGRINANSGFLNNRLRFGLNLTSAVTNNDFVPANATGGFTGGIFQNILEFSPTLPMMDAAALDGFYEQGGSTSPRNPVALAEQLDESAETTRSLGNLTTDLDILRGLTATLNVGGDRSVGRRRGYFSRFSPVAEGQRGVAFQRDLSRTSYTLQSYLTYTLQSEGPHDFTVLGGYEYNDFDTREFAIQGLGFVSDAITADNIGSAASIVADGGGLGPGSFSFRTGYKLASGLSRANYGYADKYFLTGVLRYDGSSRFSEDNRFALFPAISAAWRVSNEPFLRDNGVVSDLRLRAGFGLVGNQALPGDYLYAALLAADPGSRAVLGNGVITGVAPNQLENPDLKWEQKEEYTVGVDYGFLSNRIFGSLDFYRNTTKDLLLQVAIPAPTPVPFQIQNVGSIRNTGIDFSLDALAFQTASSSLTLGLTMSTNANEILDLGGRNQIVTGNISGRGQSNQQSLLLTPGQPYPVFYGAEFTGNYDATGAPLYNDYSDVDGDGFNENLLGTTTAPNQTDAQIIGDPRAAFTYGFRFGLEVGAFSARGLLRGEQGRQLFNNTNLVYSSQGAALSGFNLIDREFNPDENPNAAAIFSDRFVENASFLRLDQLTFEYAVPPSLFGPAVGAQVREVRLFVTGNNLFVITPYSGIDPEVNANAQANGVAAIGIDYLPYPRARTFTVGVGLGL